MRKRIKPFELRTALVVGLVAVTLISCSEPSSSQQKKNANVPNVVAGPPPEDTPIDWAVFAPIGNPNAIYAGDVTPMLAEVGADFCRVFTNGAERIIGNAPPNPPPALGGRRITIKVQDRECQNFFFTHAPSRIVYKIPDGVKRFTAIAAMPDEIHESEGTWSYIVKINDQKVFETPWLVLSKQKFWLIDVPIPSHAKTIQLIVHEGNNKFCDNAVWAWPYFHK